MQFENTAIKEKIGIFLRGLFGGRIARTTYVIRLAVLAASIYMLFLPVSTILSTSTKMVQDVYQALFFVVFAICFIGFLSAYVKRLHDIGLRGFWAVPLLLGIPAVLGYIGDKYMSFRYSQRTEGSLDPLTDLTDLTGLLFALGIILPLIAALWKGQIGENKFGEVPSSVEHIFSSRFNVIAVFGAAAILIPSSIYIGLFQPGVWVGRGSIAPQFPLIDSNSSGRLLAKCWNVKGVGASSGDGDWKGVYRDGYSDSIFDFVVADDGKIDVVPAGATISKAYRADGFEIYSYGLDLSSPESERKRFMIAAIFDGSKSPDGTVNFTTFSFAKTGDIWPEWRMVMSRGLSLGSQTLLLQKEQARGSVMVGDCQVY